MATSPHFSNDKRINHWPLKTEACRQYYEKTLRKILAKHLKEYNLLSETKRLKPLSFSYIILLLKNNYPN